MIEGRPRTGVFEAKAPPIADRCEIVRDFARLEALASEWNRLWEADPRAEVFQSFQWNRAWWRACGETADLCTPVVFAGSQVLGILPVVRSNGRLEFLGAPHADYGDVICAEENTSQVLEWSLRELQKSENWREGVLDGLPEESRIVRNLATLPADLRGRLQLVASEQCYTILVDGKPENLDRLASKQHLRRRQNKLEKTGKVSFRHIESIPEALQHLELFFVCQRRRRAIHGKSSAAESQQFRQLLRNLIQEFDLKKDLHFGVLELDRKPLAWHLSFTTRDKLVFYQQTFEVDAWDLAPGEVLLRNLLLFAKDRVGREFDFTRGDEPFKARFANHRRIVYKLWLQRPGLRGKLIGVTRRLSGATQACIRKAQSAAKADQGILENFRSARTWWAERMHRRSGEATATVHDLDYQSEHGLFRRLWEDKTVVVLEHPAKSENGLLSEPTPGRVSAAGLGELVDFAQQNPRIISPTRILSLRERFRRGDRALTLWQGSRPAHVAWITTRPLGEVVELSGASRLGSAMIVYELWGEGSKDLDAVSPLLRYVAREAELLPLPLWVCCTAGSSWMQAGLERLGFRKILEVHQQKLCGRSVRSSTSGTALDSASQNERGAESNL